MAQVIINPRAIVAPEAKLGENVVIDAYAIVEGDVEIGAGSHIHAGAILKDGTRIGQQCEVHSYAVLGGIPQDLKFIGEKTYAIIGDRTTIREYVTVNRGTVAKGITKVGSDCLIMAYAHIAHDCIVDDKVIIGNASQVAGEVEIGYHAIVSGGTLVHQFVRIGDHAMIQGGSRLVKDIPPYTLIGRDPAIYCGINIVGLRRRNFNNDQIFLINDIYRTLYTRGLNNSDAIATIEEEYSLLLRGIRFLTLSRLPSEV